MAAGSRSAREDDAWAAAAVQSVSLCADGGSVYGRTGHHDGAGSWVRRLSGMDREGFEFHRAIVRDSVVYLLQDS